MIANFFQHRQFIFLVFNQIRSSVLNYNEIQRNLSVNEEEENSDESSKTIEYCKEYSALNVPYKLANTPLL